MVVAVLSAGALTACTIARGEPEPLDALTVGSTPRAADLGSATPAIFAAAHRALVLERSEWQDGPTGAWGTVRRTGPDDERSCIPAELTVHDYRGVRVESHVLCPGLGADAAP